MAAIYTLSLNYQGIIPMKLNWFAPAIIILVGIILSVTAFIVIRSWESQDIQMKFERLIDNNFASLRRELDISIEVLLGGILIDVVISYRMDTMSVNQIKKPFPVDGFLASEGRQAL
jgi:uncharacterized membrane protein YwzB